MLRWIYFLACIFGSINLSAQGCFGYEKEHCNPPASKYIYKINDISAAYKFSSGEQRRIPFELHDSKDYRITLCLDTIFSDVVLFVIKDSQGVEIYNNNKHTFSLNLEFSSKKRQEVFLELTVPDNSNEGKNSSSIEGCIGILIEEMNTIKTGF